MDNREHVMKLILMDVLDGIEHHYGSEGLNKILEFSRLKNHARESNQFIDELEGMVGAPPR